MTPNFPSTTRDKKVSFVAFIPYKIKGLTISIFLQKRTSDAPTFPGIFLTFGGQIEPGEDSKIALMREIKEELNYKPIHEKYFGILKNPDNTEHIYAERVEDDFESTVRVMEGEYGKFFTEQEIYAEPNVPKRMKDVLPRFFDMIRSL
jgi:8-oxo-dGTP pyrophosphatase MutT (NUDIX family)